MLTTHSWTLLFPCHGRELPWNFSCTYWTKKRYFASWSVWPWSRELLSVRLDFDQDVLLNLKVGKFCNAVRIYLFIPMWSCRRLGLSEASGSWSFSSGIGMNWLTTWCFSWPWFLRWIMKLLKECNDDWMFGRDIKPPQMSSNFRRSKWHLVCGKEANYLPAACFLHLAVMCFWLPTDRGRMLNEMDWCSDSVWQFLLSPESCQLQWELNTCWSTSLQKCFPSEEREAFLPHLSAQLLEALQWRKQVSVKCLDHPYHILFWGFNGQILI